MSPSLTTIVKAMWPVQLRLALVMVGLLLVGATGCRQGRLATPTPSILPSSIQSPATPIAVLPTITAEAIVPAGWETYTNPRFHNSISYPPDMEGTDSGDYSWTLGMKLANPDEGARNFVYLSVIPAGFQSSGGDIYNYNTAEADILINMQVGESKSLREGLDTAAGFSYTRQPDTILDGQTAKVYESTQPWEFPQGTKEIRYYVQTEAYTYLLGGYLDTTGSDQPGAITEALFDQIIATFRVMR
jgi:hypothetical protein